LNQSEILVKNLNPFLLSCLLIFSINTFAQLDSFSVGSTWEFNNSKVSTSGKAYGTFVFYDGLCAVVYKDKVGFIDSTKTIVIPLKFVEVRRATAATYKFSDQRAIVFNGSHWGVIDETGKEVIPFRFDEMRKIGKYYYVYIDYKNGYIDSLGNEVITIEHEWPGTPYRTEAEIEKQVLIFNERIDKERQVTISKKKAIKIAKRNRYYHNDAWPFVPSVQLDEASKVWEIESTEKKGVTHKGKCAKTNGCITHEIYKIKIDAETGKVKSKSRHLEYIAIYTH